MTPSAVATRYAKALSDVTTTAGGLRPEFPRDLSPEAAPRELTETQRGAINAQLERITGKRIRRRYAVDPALIGGVVARIGSTVYDGSVRGQLQTLGRRLATER